MIFSKGLETRALKKQFGKLFLARMQSVTPKEAHGARIQTKRGAMFGLDARIALAIFGALSVISGAALYSAIQDSRVTAVLTEMDNVGKATTAYYLDTGIYPEAEVGGDNKTLLDTRELTSSSVTGWQGPYLPFEDGSTARMLDHPIYEEIGVYGLIDEYWDDATLGASKCLPTTSGSCSVYVCYTGLSDDIMKALDEKVDGTNVANQGSVRYKTGKPACFKTLTFSKTSAAALS